MRTVDNQVLTALHQIRDAIKNKECCGEGGGNSDSSSKEITIDDVVKFIHDNNSSSQFPYTKYDDIPELPTNSDIASLRGQIYRTSSSFNLEGYGDNDYTFILYSSSYIIVVFKMGTIN